MEKYICIKSGHRAFIDGRSSISGAIYDCIGGMIVNGAGRSLCTPSSINGELHFRPFIDNERKLINKMLVL